MSYHTPVQKYVDTRCFREHCIWRPGFVTDGQHRFRKVGIVPGTGPEICLNCGKERK